MAEDYKEKGLENIKAIYGDFGSKNLSDMVNLNPDFAKYITEFAYGEIYSREGISLKTKQIVTITSLLTQGGVEAELEGHIKGALHVGLTPQEIVDVILHCLPYVGFPKVTEALKIAKSVF
ncbi:carboxymuconolactone decarboxylase family protein [Apibacter raozihei]|uniref:carboxymuconolactone decarboxylase family protein n=1 Tax=Apibacter TaxID=1778601 RepID=UPI000FE2BD2D|nr:MULTISPECIES: carboxymuconolactone decarboxylase family protein [Apibacter]